MFILYLKPGCPYCEESKKIILTNNFKYKFIEVSSAQKREKLKVKHKMSTFPQIFYKNNKKQLKIGGNDDLIKKLKECNMLGKNLLNSFKNNTIKMDLLIIKDIYKKQNINKKYINNLNNLNKFIK